ncbi:hypothetical protein Taro_001469 [Colocasia esculenta]|uniref:Secreted protein n=1 Tax=Colocasia esculenta TaxID=4460 RepID=A0A843TI73_COLES|nr:hypothetical protein [Colocasia esculenta]
MALVVAFLLPLVGSTSACAPRVTRGAGLADVRCGKATTFYVAIRLRHKPTSRSQPLCVFKEGWPNRAFTSSARPGKELLRFLRAIRHSGVDFDVLSMQGRRMERGRHRVVAGLRVLREGICLL